MTTRPAPLPADYAERVYAGVLGKIIGVYLGRPFENWTNDAIESSLGDIEYYVNERVEEVLRERHGKPDIRVPLIVTDDDISGTFTFVRSLEDNGYDLDLTPKAIGRSWLNYLIEDRTVLWWGGLGNSTEHTAFIRLKNGVDAPTSGAMETNGQTVAEQIGGQIFIDGWAMLFPGEPDRAADFARRAASVSHDGAGVEGAQIVAALEALAFVEDGVDALIDGALEFVSGDGVIHRLITDVREWHAEDPYDWRSTFARIQQRYGYDTYGGNCHMVPNHGLIVMSLLHSDGDFSKGQTIVNTAGWDTDCNAGNLGCLMGILTGVEGIDDGPDWRSPVADRLYLPTADGGRAISDAAREADAIVRAATRLRGDEPTEPKNGARFHFSYPGSVQGFEGSNASVANRISPDGTRHLAIEVGAGESTIRTGTFVESKETARFFESAGYALMASPTLASGQTVRGSLAMDGGAVDAVSAALTVWAYGRDDEPQPVSGPALTGEPGTSTQLEFEVPNTEGRPIAFVGLTIEAAVPTSVGLDHLTWDGVPTVTLGRDGGGAMWHRAWVNGVDGFWPGRGDESFRLMQNSGTGLLLHGCREWEAYEVRADVTPHLVTSAGIAARVQGMRRHYSLMLVPGQGIELRATVDDEPEVLASAQAEVTLGTTWQLAMRVEGSSITATGESPTGRIVELTASDDRLTSGGIALACQEGRTATRRVILAPASRT